MSTDVIPWIAFILFFFLFWGLTVLEAYWLSRREWAVFGRTLSFSISSNLLGFFIGSSVVLALFFVLIMFTYEPVKNATANEFIMWVGVVLMLIFPPIFLLLVKRLLLKLFKMDAGRPAWSFSFLSSILVVFVSIAVPALFVYVCVKIFG